MTARELNRSTLGRQLLLQRERLDIPDAVKHIVAIQAQHPASPYLALWNRLIDFDPAQVDAAFRERRVVKATLMRVTLHAVHGADYKTFRGAMEPTLNGARLNDRRFRASGLTPDDARELIPELLVFLEDSRTAAESEEWLSGRLGAEPTRGAWWALRQYAPLHHSPTGGPWSFGNRPSYLAAPKIPDLGDPERLQTDLQRLAWRYLEGFGPASIADFAQFGMLYKSVATRALQPLEDRLVSVEGPEGQTMYDVPRAHRPDPEAVAPPRLMAMWDSLLLAHRDRSRFIPADYRTTVARKNGDVLPTLLVDGMVAGVWRTVDGGIEATSFHSLSEETWDSLGDEARSLLGLLADREPNVYGRYHHWWSQIEGAQTRFLPME
jgi:DNA glycosylase AlkZ-like